MRIDLTIPDDATPGRHGVYVLFDAADTALYIGRTHNLFQRLRAHRVTQPWWRQVRKLEWTACDGAHEARDLEKSMIETFRPAANINDFAPQQRSVRQKLPTWTVAKLVEMHEDCVAHLPKASEQNERLNNYILALRNAGWTLAAIAEGMRMTREAIRLRQARATRPDCSPGIPALPVKVKPAKKVKPRIPDDVLKVMLDLKEQARRVNGPTPLDSPLRAASVRYSEMLAEQLVNGVTIYRMSQQLGVTVLGIKARLARHGYVNNLDYMPQVPFETRAWTPPTVFDSGKCKRGHDTSGDNVRFVNGDPKRRICRQCERIRSDEYRARKAAS